MEWTSPKPFGLGTTRTVTMSGDLAGYEEFIAWERALFSEVMTTSPEIRQIAATLGVRFSLFVGQTY